MKIAKYFNHGSVDYLLKSVLGDNLEVFRPVDHARDWINLNIDFTRGEVRDEDWDLFIYDDIYTILRFKESGCRARNYVWYCHGTFTEWKQAQDIFNEELKNVSVIYTDDFKRSLTESWRTFSIRDTITLPIALGDEHYSTPTSKNGRVAIIGNDYVEVCSNYPRYETFAKPCLDWLLKAQRSKLDVYGVNKKELGSTVFGELDRGSTHIKQLSEHSASVHLSATASIGFVLAECFAAGIPVVATPKYQLSDPAVINSPKTKLKTKPWICVYTTDQFKKAVNALLRDPELAMAIGLAGQSMFKQKFSLEAYRQALIPWLENQVG